jgi:hypothetical protein
MRCLVGLLILFVLVPGGRAAAQATFPGTIYIQGGEDILNAELYRARGSLAAVERITDMGRVSSITAFRDRLAVSNALGSGSDRLELARLDRNPVLPGRLVDSAGRLPVYSPRGKLLFTRPRYAQSGEVIGTEVLVARTDGSRRHRVRRLREDADVGWGPGGRLAAVYGNRPRIVIDPRGRHERIVRVPLERIARLRTNVHGQMYAYDAEGNVVVIDRDGSKRRFSTIWTVVYDWAPDGSAMLVGTPDHRLGLMSPADGSVTEIGRFKGIHQAAWAF